MVLAPVAQSPIILAVCALVAALVSPASSRAQDTARVLIGAGASVGVASISSSVPVYDGDPACGVYGDAGALPIMPSVSLRLPSLFATSVGLTARAGLVLQTAELTATPIDPQRAVDPTTGALVDVQRTLELSAGLASLSLDLLATIALGDVTVSIGPSLGFHVGGQATARDIILAPSHATFRDGARERDVSRATELQRGALAAGGVANVSYLVRLGDRFFVSPHVEARFNGLSPYENESWTQWTVGGGVDLLFDVTPKPEVAPLVVVVEPPVVVEAKREPTLVVSLASLDSNGALVKGPAEVIYRDVVERRFLPLIPAVFFDSAATVLPERVVRAQSQRNNDVARVLAELSTLEAQAHLLNIVGERLRANPRLTISLVGSTSGDESRTLAVERARMVRDALVSAFGLDPSQVTVAADNRGLRMSSEVTTEGRAENRRVEIVAGDVSVLRPVLTERQIAQAVLPVRLVLDARSDVPGDRWAWTARVSDRSGEVRRIDTVHTAQTISLAPGDITPLTTSLSADVVAFVGDTLRRTVRGTTSIPLTWRSERTIIQGSTERTADRERTTWQLLGFGFNTAELLERHRDELRTIVLRIADSAHIVVTGYSDRLGEEKRNIELSGERADRIAAALREELERRGTGVASVEVVGAGVDETRFSNDLPEGRFLSRGVTIVVEQEIR